MKNVLILFGGKSTEHEISILSAKSILKSIDINLFNPIPWGIKKNGYFANYQETQKMIGKNFNQSIYKNFSYKENDISISQAKKYFDVIFPVLHGKNGEDGSIQGFLKLINLPYVGSGVLGSSLAMDKVLTKKICLSENLNILPYVSFKKEEWLKKNKELIEKIEQICNYPCFIKPANSGSSIGISKVNYFGDLSKAVEEALKHDIKILVEKGIQAREIEIGALGNNEIKLSVIGEIICSSEFYSYESKYHLKNSKLIIPAEISQSTIQKIKKMALIIFKALDLSGLARIDFFIDKNDNNSIYINEINTMPGFTKISMYSKLWEASNINYSNLISTLINLAIENFKLNKI